jgi:hypothetical protein
MVLGFYIGQQVYKHCSQVCIHLISLLQSIPDIQQTTGKDLSSLEDECEYSGAF